MGCIQCCEIHTVQMFYQAQGEVIGPQIQRSESQNRPQHSEDDIRPRLCQLCDDSEKDALPQQASTQTVNSR